VQQRVIGFSFQLAIIQHQFALHALGYCHLCKDVQRALPSPTEHPPRGVVLIVGRPCGRRGDWRDWRKARSRENLRHCQFVAAKVLWWSFRLADGVFVFLSKWCALARSKHMLVAL